MSESNSASKSNSTSIIIAIIGAVATIGAAIGGAAVGNNHAQTEQNEYLQSQIVEITGDNNNVNINDVDDLVNEFNNLLSENEALKAKNTSYFNDLTDTKNQLESVESQMKDVPLITYNNLGLVLDAQDISINKNNSMITVDGREYFSKEITEKLLPDNKNMTIKDDTIFVGKVVSDKTKLTDQWVVDDSCCSSQFSGNDSYGNPRTNAISFSSNGYIVYNLSREYSYLKCTISVSENYRMNSKLTLTITPDTGETYSVLIEKTTEPFEVEIPINNCSLLTIDTDAHYSGIYNVIISDAVVYN